MRKLFAAFAVVLFLAGCANGRPPVEVEVPQVDCLVSEVYCQYTLARGTYNTTNRALIALSKASAIDTDTLATMTALSNDVLVLLEAAKQMLAAEGDNSATAKSILDEANPKLEVLREATEDQS